MGSLGTMQRQAGRLAHCYRTPAPQRPRMQQRSRHRQCVTTLCKSETEEMSASTSAPSSSSSAAEVQQHAGKASMDEQERQLRAIEALPEREARLEGLAFWIGSAMAFGAGIWCVAGLHGARAAWRCMRICMHRWGWSRARTEAWQPWHSSAFVHLRSGHVAGLQWAAGCIITTHTLSLGACQPAAPLAAPHSPAPARAHSLPRPTEHLPPSPTGSLRALRRGSSILQGTY